MDYSLSLRKGALGVFKLYQKVLDMLRRLVNWGLAVLGAEGVEGVS